MRDIKRIKQHDYFFFCFGDIQTRTGNFLLAKQALYQLSYAPLEITNQKIRFKQLNDRENESYK